MSTWPPLETPVAVPIRRSRSRSPDRRGSRYLAGDSYVPPPDPDWPHDRRDWPDGGRRPDWDYRRGRSRSPGRDDDFGMKRRRSRSPSEGKGRYDPRPRYGDDYDYRYDRDSPRRSSYYSHRPSKLQDPYNLDFPANLRYFSDWFRATHPELAAEEESVSKDGNDGMDVDTKGKGIRARYEDYKKAMTASQMQTLYQHHKTTAWFIERYSPDEKYVTLRKRVRRDAWKNRVATFMRELEDGKFDVLATQPDPAVAPTQGTNGSVLGGDVEVVATSPVDDAELDRVDNEIKVEEDETDLKANVKVESESGTGSRKINGGHGSGTIPPEEEASVMPDGNEAMIRTIPPDIGRMKLEEACSNVPGFVYLALGDPMQKRNYYRAGWLKFKDDADMPEVVKILSEKKIDGFKLHVTHNTRPFVTRIRFAPSIAGSPERIAKDLASAKRLATKLEADAAEFSSFKEPPKPTNGKSKAKTDAKEEETESGEQPAPEIEVDADTEPKEKGSEAVERRLQRLYFELEASADDEKDLQVKKSTIALDLYRAYLRTAFNCCFYCVAVCDYPEELHRKCVKHLRRPWFGDKPEPKDERWTEWLDSKLMLLIDPESVDPKEHGGKNVDDELKTAVQPHIKQEDEGKFRCRTCNKLFKAMAFVEKHVQTKHGELIKSVMDELPFYNNFALDPQHIQPFLHPPPPSGNGQVAPREAFGLRGYDRDRDRERSRSYSNYGHPVGYGPHSNGSSSYDYPPVGHHHYPPPGRHPAEGLRDYGRRLSGRIDQDPGENAKTSLLPQPPDSLPAKPPAVALEPEDGGRRRRNTGGRRDSAGAMLPPPPHAKEDPRASGGRRVSYHDMDGVAEGDVELMY